MTEKIKVENLTKVFGKKSNEALKMLKNGATKKEISKKISATVGIYDASFNVQEREIFVIMGLSGSGKSTLIRCLNLLNRPTCGNIFVDGENIVNYDKKQLRKFRQNKMAMVFQHFGLFNHKTVLENVEFGLEVKKIEKEERRKISLNALETVGLKGWENKMPGELSGGMQQRVGLARAIANNPDILLMDEPFSALDPLIRREMQIELLDIQSTLKKTIVFITHDINEAFKLGDRIAVMKDGRIVQIGTPEEILSSPSDEYIEDFVRDIDRTKVIQAQNVMKKPIAIVSLKDGIKVAIKEMKSNDISSVFVVDKDRKLKGIVTIDDAIEAVNNGKKLNDILKNDYYVTNPEEYIENLIPVASKAKYPIAVTDENNKLKGIIVRASILSGLVSNI